MHETYGIERLASDTRPKHWSEWKTQITSRDNEILTGENYDSLQETTRHGGIENGTMLKHWSEQMTWITSRGYETLNGKYITTYRKRQRGTRKDGSMLKTREQMDDTEHISR